MNDIVAITRANRTVLVRGRRRSLGNFNECSRRDCIAPEQARMQARLGLLRRCFQGCASSTFRAGCAPIRGCCLVRHVEYLTVGQAAISPRFPYRIRLLDDSAEGAGERLSRCTQPRCHGMDLIPMLGQPLREWLKVAYRQNDFV